MTLVYTLILIIPYEGQFLQGIYSTKEKAEKARTEHEDYKGINKTIVSLIIEEWELDK